MITSTRLFLAACAAAALLALVAAPPAHAAAAADSVGPVPFCAPPGVCMLNTVGGVQIFTRPGEVSSLGLHWTCNDTGSAAPQRPFLTAANIDLSSDTAAVVQGSLVRTERSVVGDNYNCTGISFSFNLTTRMTTSVDVEFTNSSGAPIRSATQKLQACFPSAPGCTNKCCNGGEKWTAAAYSMAQECNTGRCCCLTSLSVQSEDHGTSLSMFGWAEGRDCPGADSRNRVPFTKTLLPMPDGDHFAVDALNWTVHVALSGVSGAGPIEGAVTWANSDGEIENCAAATHHKVSPALVVGLSVGFLAVVVAVGAIIARKRRGASDTSAQPLIHSSA